MWELPKQQFWLWEPPKQQFCLWAPPKQTPGGSGAVLAWELQIWPPWAVIFRVLVDSPADRRFLLRLSYGNYDFLVWLHREPTPNLAILGGDFSGSGRPPSRSSILIKALIWKLRFFGLAREAEIWPTKAGKFRKAQGCLLRLEETQGGPGRLGNPGRHREGQGSEKARKGLNYSTKVWDHGKAQKNEHGPFSFFPHFWGANLIIEPSVEARISVYVCSCYN